MSPLRIGIIGGGGIAGAHLPRLRECSDDVSIVGIADPGPKAKATAEKFNIERVVDDYRALLPDVDAVIVCVPTHLHADIVVESLQAGKHVFCEKPMARTLAQADAMRDAARASGKTLQIGFVRRFDEEWLAWRRAVQENRLGRPVVWRDVMAASYMPGRWYLTHDEGGGPFLDACVHNYDFALHTFGPAQWVFAHLRTMQNGYDAYDTGTATIHFHSGDELLLAWSWGLAADCRGGRVFELHGPEGSITWSTEDPAENRRRLLLSRPNEKIDLPFEMNSLVRGFSVQMDEFIDAAHGRTQPRAGPDEGREALRLALAVLESARTGQRVDL